MSQQLDMKYDPSIDYSSHSFCAEIRMDDQAYPAAFQTEFFASQGALYATGRMVVLLAHPDYGNITFFLRSVVADDELDHRWVLDTPSFMDEPTRDLQAIAAAYPFDIADTIIEQCESRIKHAHA